MSAWDTGSGLVEEYDGEVIDAYFEEGEYGGTLKLIISSPAVDDDLENWYPCGKKVAVVSDNEVDLSAMRGGVFNKNSGVGQLIEAIKTDEGLIAQVGEAGPAFADSFKGLKAHWKLHTYTANINGEKREYTRILPTKAIGDGAKGGAKAKAEEPEQDIPEWLAKLAVSHDSYDEFVEEALDHEDMTRELRKLVTKESLWDFS